MAAQAQIPELETEISASNTISFSELFAIVQQFSSQFHDNRMQSVVETIKDFPTNDNQLIVDLLSIALEKHYHILMHPDRALNLLTEIVSLTNIVARNRTLNPDQLISDMTSPGGYIIKDEPNCRVRVIKHIKKGPPGAFSKVYIKWAHLSHPNVLPVYGVFPDNGNGSISLISLLLDQRNIVDHAKALLQVNRMPLISDILDGLCYLHQLDVVHGSLNPESVLILDNQRAVITDLDLSSANCGARYSAPEVLENEDINPTKAADIWALGCLFYEMLSGNVPFCQHRQEGKVAAAVVKGKKPTRPGQDGVEGEEIIDVTWRPVSACWEFDPEDRPSCLKLHDVFASMDFHDSRPAPKPMIPSATLEIESPDIDLESSRSLFIRLFGTDQLLPLPSQIPEHLRESLTGLADGLPKANAVAAAAKKLEPDDTQTLVDALDLVLEENPSFVEAWNPVSRLMTMIMESTHVCPQHYKFRRVRYDPSPIAEDSFGKVYKGRDLDVCVNMVTDSSDVANIFAFLARWAHSSHPNILPFYGVFDEPVDEIPRFCFVSPFMKHGTLYEYAPLQPQKSRISLISDVINGLDYLPRLFVFDDLRPDTILISNDGRAMVPAFEVAPFVTLNTTTKSIRSSASRAVRFLAPERVNSQASSPESDVWSYGCLCYEVLSGKPPYHQYTQKDEVESALRRGEPPRRPCATDNNIELIDDSLWDLITGCCRFKPEDRLTAPEIQKLLANLTQAEHRTAQKSPGIAILSLRKRPDIDWNRIKRLLGQIQVELLRNPLSKLIQNHIKNVATEVVKLQHDDVQTLVDFLDVTLKDHLTISEERNRVLALISRVVTSAQVFPQRHMVKGIKYHPKPIAEGGFGRVHRGLSDPTICVKVTTRVNDPHALVAYIRELVLWAHSSHPNILPFYGVFVDESQQICLVSPYMAKGNLSDYARQLPQSSRVPLLLDTIKGLNYLHGLGIVHTDLKGENVLISDEGRGLITDFGASHIVTATAKGGVTAASVATTLRFTAPEVVQDQTRRVRPSKECDIWSFGCLCYQVLSRKLPYYEYQIDAQVLAALFRGQLPKRPGPTKIDNDDDSDGDWDDFDEKDWDDLDNTIWSLIMKCLVLKPDHRLTAPQIEELIIDMKAWDSRPTVKGVPGAESLKQKLNVEVNLNRAGVLLDRLQIFFLVRRLFGHSDREVVAAVANLDEGEGRSLTDFLASALWSHLYTFTDQSRLLAVHTALMVSRRRLNSYYFLRNRPHYHPEVIAEGSFGKLHRGSEVDVCVKVTTFLQVKQGFAAQWDRALAPWAHSSHPNILPFYGACFSGNRTIYLVSPFIKNGNLQSYAPCLSQESRMLLILDVIEALVYLHKLGIIHSNLKTQNVLVSDEGRALVTDFRPYYVSVAAGTEGPTDPFATDTLRFTAPELVKQSQMLPTATSDIWSVGCLIYEVLSQKVPYYQYSENSEIRAALSRDELPIRPNLADGDTDEIEEKSWGFVTHCCDPDPANRPGLTNIQDWLKNMNLHDKRPAGKPLPGAEILKQRWSPIDIDVSRLEEILGKLKDHLPQIAPEKDVEQ